MTKIFCSNKLKDFLGQKFFTSVSETTNLFGDWNAHLFYLNRQKNIILVNNKSYYSVILTNIKKSDFYNFDTLFFDRLTQQLLYDNVIDPEEVLLVIQKYTPLVFSKTNNDKKTIGTINEFIFQYLASQETPFWLGKSLLELNKFVNDSLTGAGRTKKGDYGRPIEDMRILLIS